MFSTLIVEDNEAFRRSLRGVLARRFPFMRIDEAADGEEGMNRAVSLRPDLVLMDIRLPGRNGLELTRAIRLAKLNAIVCIITSHDLPEYRDAASASGADHFFVKDESTEAVIVEMVDSILSGRVRTLIIEDNGPFRRALSRMLANRWPAMVVAEAADATEGLEDVVALKPDVVLLDLHLPSAHGLDLVDPIKSGYDASTIVVVTSYDLPEYREAAIRCGIAYFIAKGDMLEEEIVAALEAILPPQEAMHH